LGTLKTDEILGEGSPVKDPTPLYKMDVKKKMKVKVDLRKNKKKEFRDWYL